MSYPQEMPELPYGGVFVSFIDSSEEENRNLREELFTGELLRWAGKRLSSLGDFIMPKIIYIEAVEDETHKVAWVEHNGLNPKTEERFHNHHVVCECVLCKRFDNGRGSIDTSQCEVMSHALEARAQLIRAEFQPSIVAYQESEAIDVMVPSRVIDSRNPFDIESLSVSAIEQVLRSDSRHPEGWHGNVVSGSLPLEQASAIIDQPLDSTIQYAELLSKAGKVEFDGESLRLAA